LTTSILNRLYDNKFKEKLIEELCFDNGDIEWYYRNRFNELFDELQEHQVEKIFDEQFIEKLIDQLCFDCGDFEWHIKGKLYELVDTIKGDVKIES